jgi:EAL domain-containing protein (putative c-di-GMP-specific phosphodiesterase class I)/CheY-like chemotaxis protein
MSAEAQPSEAIDGVAPQDAKPAEFVQQPPLAIIVDAESSIRQFISLILQGHGIDTMEFPDGVSLRRARTPRAPQLIFLNVGLETQDAIQTIEALGKAGYGGMLQLMSGRGAAVLDTARNAGEQYRLKMLPALKKPFETAAIQQIIFEQNLGQRPPAEVRIALSEAIKQNWIEFWYQPKIDLRKKQLAGAEAFARVRHPQHGVLPPANFMPGADDASLLALAEQALVGALKSGLNMSRLGVNLRIAINVSIGALVKLPVGDIVRAHRPQVSNWPGIVIDIPEEQIVSEVALASELTKSLSEHGVRLAIDDFGKSYTSLVKVKEMPFAEMKLDRSFVIGCGSDRVHAPVCKTVIDLAHSFGSLAVGIGLENASDAMALVNMGCDLGQGFLLGQPMPEERFISVLKQRVTVRPASGAPARPAQAGAAVPQRA